MTNQDYEQKKRECWEEFRKEHPEISCKSLLRNFVDFIFDRAYALGKQEKDAEDTVIQGWVAKDNDIDGVYLYNSMPERGINVWNGHMPLLIHLDSKLFPDLTWESEPQEVEIIIKRKKNG